VFLIEASIQRSTVCPITEQLNLALGKAVAVDHLTVQSYSRKKYFHWHWIFHRSGKKWITKNVFPVSIPKEDSELAMCQLM